MHQAQNIAELAVCASEGYTDAKEALNKCLEEKEVCITEREQLLADMDSLKSQIAILQQAASKAEESER